MNIFEVEEEKPNLDLNEIAKFLAAAPVLSLDLETSGFSVDDDIITIVSVACEVGNEIKGWAIQTRYFPLTEIRDIFF